MKRRDDWIDDDEYPSDRDVDDFGDDSPPDYHPLTIGYVGSTRRHQFWTPGRIALAVIIALILAALLVPVIAPLL